MSDLGSTAPVLYCQFLKFGNTALFLKPNSDVQQTEARLSTKSSSLPAP